MIVTEWSDREPWRGSAREQAYQRRYQAKRREHWRAAGRCVECGAERKFPTLRCGLCLIGNCIRFERSRFKLRMAKAKLK